MAYQIVAAIISESKLKKHHKDEFINIREFRIHRRDRIGRGGGGVAIYVANIYSSSVCSLTSDNSEYELLWIRVEGGQDATLIGALYHPPGTESYIPGR